MAAPNIGASQNSQSCGRRRRPSGGTHLFVAALCPAIFNPYVTALDVPGFAQAVAEGGCDLSIFPRRSTIEKSDDGCRLLPPRRQRPRRRAAKQREGLAAFHSRTSLARAMNTADKETPSEAAVLRLTAM